MSVEHLIKTWKETRGGLVEEATQVPPEEFTFRATKDTALQSCCSTLLNRRRCS